MNFKHCTSGYRRTPSRGNFHLLRTLAVLLGLILSLCCQAQSEVPVRVLGYPFPPYVYPDQQPGLTSELLKLLNQSQQRYRFELELTTPNRRYSAFEHGLADMMLFEMPSWEWRHRRVPHTSTSVLLNGKEVYIALNQSDRNQRFFDDLSSRRLVIIQGYHYGFAGFNTDRSWLKQQYDVLITTDHQQLVDLVLNGRADVGVITQAYLNRLIANQPSLAERLLISDKADQHYRLRALFSTQSPIDADTFENLFLSLQDRTEYHQLLKRFGVQP